MPWSKGQSGNPKGRPPKEQCVTDLLRHKLEADGHKKMNAVVDKLYAMAMAGDVTAIKMIVDRIDGKLPESSKVETSGETTVHVIRS
jgi:hypothetical protein